MKRGDHSLIIEQLDQKIGTLNEEVMKKISPYPDWLNESLMEKHEAWKSLENEIRTSLINKFPPMPIGSMEVVVSDLSCVAREWKQYRFPKSKKARIRKKWSKRNSNYRMEEVHRVIKMHDRILVSSLVFEKMKGLAQE